MKNQDSILIFGSSGQIGKSLIRILTKNNYRVIAVTRSIHRKGYQIKTQSNYGYLELEEVNSFSEEIISKLMKKETFREIGKRAKIVIKNIIKDNLNKNILIVTHGSFIANGIRNIFDLRQIPEKTVGNGNCCLTVIKLGNNKKELIMSFNNIHLNELY